MVKLSKHQKDIIAFQKRMKKEKPKISFEVGGKAKKSLRKIAEENPVGNILSQSQHYFR